MRRAAAWAGRSSSPRALPMRTVSTCNTRRVSARFRLSTSFCASPTATTAGKLRHASSIPPRQTTSSTETTIKTCLSWTTTTTSSAPTTRSNATKAVHTTISTRCRKSITIPDTATVSDCRPGMSIRSGDFRCCRSHHKENDDYLNQQREQTLRSILSWDHLRKKWKVGVKAGYIHTWMAYDYERELGNGKMEKMIRSRKDDQHLLRPGGRRILPRGEVALHGNRFGTPASGTKHRQKHYPDG